MLGSKRNVAYFLWSRCCKNSSIKLHALSNIFNSSQKRNNQILFKKFTQNHVAGGDGRNVRTHRPTVPCMHFNSSSTPSTGVSGWRLLWRNIFGKYLLATNIIGSGLLMVIGDFMAQQIEYRRELTLTKEINIERIGRMFIVGALQGPLHHYAYLWMDKIMPVANNRNTIIKILFDELIMSPVCILLFFYSVCFLERRTLKEANEELKDKFLFIYLIDWLVWPAAQYINFRYLDLRYRVTYVNICTAIYNVFMSYMKHEEKDKLQPLLNFVGNNQKKDV